MDKQKKVADLEKCSVPQMPDTFLYGLAHHAVRQLFFSDPKRFLHLASTEWELGFADYIWEYALPHAAPDSDWSGQRKYFTAKPVKMKRGAAILVAYPPPPEQALCHMVLAVMTKGRPPVGRYFTLERGRTKRDTVLCEWSEDDRHRNYSAGPAPHGDAFVAAVELQLHRD